MAGKIKKSTHPRKVLKFKRKKRIRRQLDGTAERPRFCVVKSNKALHVQIVDDTAEKTLISAHNTGAKSINCESATELGKKVASLAKEKGISQVVFDRCGSIYHGRIKALAQGAREGGLNF